MFFEGDDSAQTTRLDDPRMCLLYAAFTLRGRQFPQGMFSTGMDDAAQLVSGFEWLKESW